ncbi:MAG: glycosyltransferase family 4 protein, partial [Pseudonocardiaceae bacterium]
MRICLVHRDLHAVTRGGIGTVYRELDRRLRHAGHDVTLLTQQSQSPLNQSGADVLTLPRTEDLVTHRRAVAEVLTQMRPDVVECSTWEAEALHYLRQPRAERAPVVIRGEFS